MLPQPLRTLSHRTLAHPLGPAALDPAPLALPLSDIRTQLGFPSPAEA